MHGLMERKNVNMGKFKEKLKKKKKKKKNERKKVEPPC